MMSAGNRRADRRPTRHERQLSSATAHGQQTAASHKAANHGSAGTRSHPAHPSKPAQPTHPAHPPNPSAEKGPSSPPASPAAPGSHAHDNAATPAAGGKKLPWKKKTARSLRRSRE